MQLKRCNTQQQANQHRHSSRGGRRRAAAMAWRGVLHLRNGKHRQRSNGVCCNNKRCSSGVFHARMGNSINWWQAATHSHTKNAHVCMYELLFFAVVVVACICMCVCENILIYICAFHLPLICCNCCCWRCYCCCFYCCCWRLLKCQLPLLAITRYYKSHTHTYVATRRRCNCAQMPPFQYAA